MSVGHRGKKNCAANKLKIEMQSRSHFEAKFKNPLQKHLSEKLSGELFRMQRWKMAKTA